MKPNLTESKVFKTQAYPENINIIGDDMYSCTSFSPFIIKSNLYNGNFEKFLDEDKSAWEVHK